MFDEYTAQVEVVFLGDSLTEQAPWEEMFPDIRFANRGVSGDTFADILARLDQVSALQPKAVFLLAGINDARIGDLEASIMAIRRIVETFQSKGVDVFLQSSPVPNWPNGKSARIFIKELNLLISELAAEKNVQFIDVASIAPLDGLSAELAPDGVHLNGLGYKNWEGILHQHLVNFNRDTYE
ncbi:GDSL-type esterase/lipase family protein [Mangrovicoccus sp. HB161399]|uniref:GDSL-type esterase/lipase family protein n=1 Tax=Mangrovicoccus sp. HB161399 TaxID=2720392 RepID=UPI0015570E7B